MKNTVIKMALVVLMISGLINIYKAKNYNLIEKQVKNDITYESEALASNYEPEIVYEGLTLEELAEKIDKHLNSTLDGYGKTIAEVSLSREVDPVVAASIILLETGCKWSCSSLVETNNNVGGMRGSSGWMKFASLEEGINAFVGNLAVNYYAKGLTTPELMNTKYATSNSWATKVNNYIRVIKAS